MKIELIKILTVMATYNYDFTAESVISFDMVNQQMSLSTDSVGPDCSNVQLPPELTLEPLRYEYSVLNDGFAFGESISTNAITEFSRNQYLEISNLFTNNQNYRRKLQFFPVPSDIRTPYVITMSISECPGDFTNSAVCNRSLVATTFPQVRISTYPGDDTETFCVIEPGKSYYLNMIHDINPFDGTPGRCARVGDEFCGVFFNELTDQ